MLPEQKHCDVVTVDVITEMAPKWLMDREREDPGQRDDPCPGQVRTERDKVGCRHVTHKGMQFKIYELFISGISHLVFFRL